MRGEREMCSGVAPRREPRRVRLYTASTLMHACTSYPIPSYTVVTYPAFIHFSFGNVLPETVLPWGFNGFAPETGGVQGSSADNDEFTVVNENGGESRCRLRLFLNQCSVCSHATCHSPLLHGTYTLRPLPFRLLVLRQKF